MLYDELEPFGSPREDERAGIVAAVLGNIYRTKDAAVFDWRDFYPEHAVDKAPVLPSQDELAAKLHGWAAASRMPRRRVIQKPSG